VFTPGVYTLEDLPEEAKIPGASIKINDQLNRTYTLKVDYFSGYGMLKAGKDDFDIAIVREHKWDVDDPHRIGYFKKPRYSANYRYGISDETTIGAGMQGYENTQIFDVTAIFATDFGMLSPHASFSNGNSVKNSNKAIGGGILYVLPKNDLGIFFETFLGVKGKGFGDLGKEKDVSDEYNKLIDKYFTNATLKEQFKNSVSETTTKQIIARVYTKPIFGIIPSFTFNGSWTKDSRLREYTLSFTKKIWDCLFTVSGGLSYDDPSKGANLQSPDRRLTVACCIPIGTDFKIQGSYFHHDEEQYRSYEKLQYSPSEIPGLEFNAEHYSRPDFRNPCASVKYDGKYCNLKAEETIRNSYSEKNKQHINQQRFFFGTSVSPSRIRAYQKSNFNVLRTGRTEKKK
jgi:outer membrane usher protein FimD/PapC